MAETKIEWTRGPNGEKGYTFNPWTGCTKVSPACDHCYAESWAKRSNFVSWGSGTTRRRTTEANWRQPLKWNAEAERQGIRYRVFCASLADVFDNEVPIEWLIDLVSLIEATPNLDWLLLTKRIGTVRKRLAMAAVTSQNKNLHDYIVRWLTGDPPRNVMLGATVVNQAEADRDIPKLLDTPARTRFLSMEPLLGPVDLSKPLGLILVGIDQHLLPNHYPAIDWVIVGGESGPGARPMHPAWVRELRDQCVAAGVHFFLKQWGEWASAEAAGLDLNDCYDNSHTGGWLEIVGSLSTGRDAAPTDKTSVHLFRLGKKKAGSMLDGRAWTEVPA